MKRALFFFPPRDQGRKKCELREKFPVKSGTERKAGSMTRFDSQFEPWCEYFSGVLPCFSVNFN
jgi:hypothetical protein